MPGTAVAAPSVFVIERSAVGVSVSVSVALLLPGVGSVMPPGTATVAVFDSVPVAVAEIVQLALNVAVPPTARSTALVEMFPDPDAGQLLPTLAAQVQVQALRDTGKVSLTDAPVTGLGPPFDAVIV